MKHLGTQKIETDRLVLRKFSLGDSEAMYRNWASDDQVTKFLTWPTHRNVEDSKSVIEDWLASYSEDNFYQWAITLKGHEEDPIGGISVVDMNEDISMVDIGYCIGRAWWNRGITTEALRAVMDFLFEDVEVNRIQARHDSRNPSSGRVMEKCGMKYEGTLRSSDRNNEGVCDVRYYGILREEWVVIAPMGRGYGDHIPAIDWATMDVMAMDKETRKTVLPADWNNPADDGLYDALA